MVPTAAGSASRHLLLCPANGLCQVLPGWQRQQRGLVLGLACRLMQIAGAAVLVEVPGGTVRLQLDNVAITLEMVAAAVVLCRMPAAG